jgi:hypothetical protein
MRPSYYYFGAPDSDSTDDTYVPTRECFHIDGLSASDSEDEAPVEGRNTPPQVKLPTEAQAHTSVGRAIHRHRSAKAQHLQAIEREGRNLHQRLKR